MSKYNQIYVSVVQVVLTRVLSLISSISPLQHGAVISTVILIIVLSSSSEYQTQELLLHCLIGHVLFMMLHS
jgi:hypothetical protein